jgi:hypothetical protein
LPHADAKFISHPWGKAVQFKSIKEQASFEKPHVTAAVARGFFIGLVSFRMVWLL